SESNADAQPGAEESGETLQEQVDQKVGGALVPPSFLARQVSELVQFLLVKDQKKIPIKRSDILKKVIREYKDVYSEIVNRAGRTLQQVFGLQLVEIDTKHHIYILISTLPRAEGENLRQDDQTAKLGLLTVILSFIFMKGNSAKDGAVWEFLRRLRVHPGERHEVFGDVKKLVTEEFVRQK
ncbi:LOW QUALITY PROTEIN: non-structural maintenance of chromosomes element 3 homolog, partial [Struthio camelus]|uniref:LOW QUALITY PROTEIN: non-structural maintenance of chromosomes element 3 homolog n=1 Tax=Struthio camelus TaxID=8801 RepID=UPI003603AEF6